jgi:integrase/recombinase XerC
LERAGLSAKAISPHALRHTYAIRALRAGGNVIAVQKLLGHASVATTQRYLDHLALSADRGHERGFFESLPNALTRTVAEFSPAP